MPASECKDWGLPMSGWAAVSAHTHTQDLGLGAGLVRELRKLAAARTGEHQNQGWEQVRLGWAIVPISIYVS